MRGFLGRAGHLLGRLAVSLGYGDGRSLYDDATAKSVVCLSTEFAAAALETTPMSSTACLATELASQALTTEPVDTLVGLATEPTAPMLATEPSIAVMLMTEPEEC